MITDDNIEFLDSARIDDPQATRGRPGREATPPSDEATQRNASLTIAAVVAVFGALFFVSTVGNNEPDATAPATTAPATNTPPTTTPSTAALAADDGGGPTQQTSQAREEQLANLGITVGDGPDLDWQRVDIASPGAVPFAWVGDRFVAENRGIEYSVQLSDDGVPIAVAQPGAAADFPGYSLQVHRGARVLVPDSSDPDHVLLLDAPTDEPVRLELPASATPTGPLISRRVYIDGAVIGQRFVAVVSRQLEIDIAALSERTDRDLGDTIYVEVWSDQLRLHTLDNPGLDPVDFDEAGFTESEIAQLLAAGGDQAIESLVISSDLVTGETLVPELDGIAEAGATPTVRDGQLEIIGFDGSGAPRAWTTNDGVTWVPVPATGVPWVIDSGTQLFLPTGDNHIERSVDRGATWERTRTLSGLADPLFVDDLVVIGRSWDSVFLGSEVTIESAEAEYDLTFVDQGPLYEVRDTTGEVVTSGYLWDEASGVTRNDTNGDYVFADPASEVELLTVPEIDVVIARAKASPTREVVMALWPADQQDPEWLLASPSELFGEGSLTVDFYTGDSQLLAVVTTLDGYAIFITDVSGAS